MDNMGLLALVVLMPDPTSYTAPLSSEQAETLRALLQERGFEFKEKPYSIFSAARGKLNVTVYEKGPKVLVQGKETGEFVRFTLEPEILKEARLGYEEVHEPEMFAPHFGVDESGKGDFFGPLVIAGAYVDADIARALREAGIMDSKRITSDKRIRDLSEAIRGVKGIVHEVVTIGPERYNEMHNSFGNLNRLLAWGHATVIENLLQRRPDCPRALSDQFANPKVLEKALQTRGKTIQIDQKTKAESDVAVAAASILAREAFIDWLDQKGRELELGSPLPRGASEAVRETAVQLARKFGGEILPTVTKTHFRTTQDVISAL
jgi:ribonuclease HIII